MDTRLRYIVLAAAFALATPGLSAQTREEIPRAQTAPATSTAIQEQTARPLRQDTVNQASIARRQLQLAAQASPDAPRTMPINWVAARQDVRQQTATSANVTAARQVPRFPQPDNEEAQNVTATRLPVLIPAIGALGLGGDPRVLLIPRADFYTFSIIGTDILIEVFGTRLAHARAPDAATAERLRASDEGGYRSAGTRYGREISFNRYGAAYSVTIECAAPQNDLRCTTDDYARQIARSLLIAAGSPDEGGN